MLQLLRCASHTRTQGARAAARAARAHRGHQPPRASAARTRCPGQARMADGALDAGRRPCCLSLAGAMARPLQLLIAFGMTFYALSHMNKVFDRMWETCASQRRARLIRCAFYTRTQRTRAAAQAARACGGRQAARASAARACGPQRQPWPTLKLQLQAGAGEQQTAVAMFFAFSPPRPRCPAAPRRRCAMTSSVGCAHSSSPCQRYYPSRCRAPPTPIHRRQCR